MLLKITVPKRTGRKRKRGSQDPYVMDSSGTVEKAADPAPGKGPPTELQSHSRLDNPKWLLRALKDNVGIYQIEAVGSIDQTHRYRGMSCKRS